MPQRSRWPYIARPHPSAYHRQGDLTAAGHPRSPKARGVLAVITHDNAPQLPARHKARPRRQGGTMYKTAEIPLQRSADRVVVAEYLEQRAVRRRVGLRPLSSTRRGRGNKPLFWSLTREESTCPRGRPRRPRYPPNRGEGDAGSRGQGQARGPPIRRRTRTTNPLERTPPRRVEGRRTG